MDLIYAQSTLFFSVAYLISLAFTLSCSDWFLIWVGLEINMMSFIALIFNRTSSGVEVCLKYFFIQSLGSGLLMLMFYSEFKWFDYVSLGVLSYKVGGGPFFFWFPSMCENLGWGSCLVLMTLQKVLPLLIISFLVSMFLWFVIMTSIVIGGLGAMNQKSLKRLMAYSSIHHIGWILIGNFCGGMMWVIYLILYSLLMMGILLNLWKNNIVEVGGLVDMGCKWSFVVGVLSLGGMPPLLGFYLKWWLFYNLLGVDYSNLLLMVVMSVLMFYVYLRIVFMVIMGGSSLSSWVVMKSKSTGVSVDLIYMLGFNVGVSVWMFML